jgi:hypothetical protein
MTDSTSSEEKELVEYMLTTVDNPFDPFTQFKQWHSMDMALGYDTPGLLARVAITSNELSDLDLFIAVQEGIEKVVDMNIFGVHRKVKRGDVVVENQEFTTSS